MVSNIPLTPQGAEYYPILLMRKLRGTDCRDGRAGIPTQVCALYHDIVHQRSYKGLQSSDKDVGEISLLSPDMAHSGGISPGAHLSLIVFPIGAVFHKGTIVNCHEFLAIPTPARQNPQMPTAQLAQLWKQHWHEGFDPRITLNTTGL